MAVAENRRVILIVLDSVGAGEAPDAAAYGDVGSNTLGNIAAAMGGLHLPNLIKLWQWNNLLVRRNLKNAVRRGVGFVADYGGSWQRSQQSPLSKQKFPPHPNRAKISPSTWLPFDNPARCQPAYLAAKKLVGRGPCPQLPNRLAADHPGAGAVADQPRVCPARQMMFSSSWGCTGSSIWPTTAGKSLWTSITAFSRRGRQALTRRA